MSRVVIILILMLKLSCWLMGELLKMISEFFDTILIVFGNFLAIRYGKVFWLILYISCFRTGICHFFQETWFLVGNGVPRPQYLLLGILIATGLIIFSSSFYQPEVVNMTHLQSYTFMMKRYIYEINNTHLYDTIYNKIPLKI